MVLPSGESEEGGGEMRGSRGTVAVQSTRSLRRRGSTVSTDLKGLTFASNITLVFTTSKGVVTAAANPPAIMPHTAACPEEGRFPERYLRDNSDFSPSYRGNCMEVNGS